MDVGGGEYPRRPVSDWMFVSQHDRNGRHDGEPKGCKLVSFLASSPVVENDVTLALRSLVACESRGGHLFGAIARDRRGGCAPPVYRRRRDGSLQQNHII